MGLTPTPQRANHLANKHIRCCAPPPLDGLGCVSVTELRIIMCTMGDKLSDEEMNEMLQEVEGRAPPAGKGLGGGAADC